MSFDLNEATAFQIEALKREMGKEAEGLVFCVSEEQAFMKNGNVKPNVIYVLTKQLESTVVFGGRVQPFQIYVLSEENSIEKAIGFFRAYADKYKLRVTSETANGHTSIVKQQYSDPVVLGAFTEVGYGYRTSMYISGNAVILEDALDVRDLTIDGNGVTALTFDIAYAMAPSSVQPSEAGRFISRSVKSAASLSITITMPAVASPLATKVIRIIDEADSSAEQGEADATAYGGNENFAFDFYWGDYHVSGKKMKLIACNQSTAVNDLPAWRLSFAL